jgi:uncharacterized protein DUF955
VNAELQRHLDRYGLRVRFADLGDWGVAELRAEYDPSGPEIRVSRNLAPGLIEEAIAHELYHHLEAIGEIVAPSDRSSREFAARAYARALLEASA